MDTQRVKIGSVTVDARGEQISLQVAGTRVLLSNLEAIELANALEALAVPADSVETTPAPRARARRVPKP